ncbi:Clp protease ClpB [Alteribacter populi]|uniref:phage scaffolding protein n=1 Tax=Alteribacter populi TaxID=2011011 RepID=UPI0018E2F834|nr:Clp protease ClpB [Alteribacter populi]
MVEETKDSQVTETDESVNETQTVEEPETKPEEQAEAKTFTQDEVNALIADRLSREKKKYSDYESVKEKAERFEKEAEERRLAEMSEKERAEELAKKYETEKAEIAQQLEEFKSQVQREKVTNEFIKKAQAANIAYVDDALALADLSAVTVEDGKVNGVDDVVQSLIENKPFLLAQKKAEAKEIGSPSNYDDKQAEKTADQLLQEAAQKAKRSGKTEDLAAYQQLKRELGR